MKVVNERKKTMRDLTYDAGVVIFPFVDPHGKPGMWDVEIRVRFTDHDDEGRVVAIEPCISINSSFSKLDIDETAILIEALQEATSIAQDGYWPEAE